ncbi:MAG: D-alanyl-D-alanine carboxypeptidase/D-alanyl-D-alanine-endopeptidase [Candidatus Nanopelagicales bacterium]
MRLAAGVGLVLMLIGTVAVPANAAPGSGLGTRLDQAVTAGALGRDVTVAVSVDGQLLYEYDGDEKQIPASTMKVVTAATSLTALGVQTRFPTSVVQGDSASEIILVGGGDPLLSRGDINKLAGKTAKVLRKRGTTSVSLAVDDYLFPSPSDAPGWEPGDSPTYASAVRALGFAGDYSSDTTAAVRSTFASALRSKGITVRDAGRALADKSARQIARLRGGKLSTAIEWMLRVSENNVAENLFRHVALSQGYPATWSGGQAAAREVLQSLGLRTYQLKLIDGSGLSGKDKLTAEALTQVLDRVVNGDHPQLAPILDWLPVAGRTGTLTYRFNGAAACARDEVFAKTGSLTGVNTLAGLTKVGQGRWVSFAVMVNHRPMGYPNTSTSLAVDTIAAKVNGCA